MLPIVLVLALIVLVVGLGRRRMTSRRIQRIGNAADYSSWDRGERSTSVGFAKQVRRRRRFNSRKGI